MRVRNGTQCTGVIKGVMVPRYHGTDVVASVASTVLRMYLYAIRPCLYVYTSRISVEMGDGWNSSIPMLIIYLLNLLFSQAKDHFYP